MKAVLEYRKAYNNKRDDVEFKSRLKQTELKCAEFYYQRGSRAMQLDDLDGAIAAFQQGLIAMPEHAKLSQALNEALSRKEAASLHQEGMRLLAAGKNEDARRLFRKALDFHPDNKEAAAQLAELEKQERSQGAEGLVLGSTTPVTLNFRQTDVRAAFDFLTKSFGVNVIFDDSLKGEPITLFAKNVTFEQGLALLLATSKTFYKKIGPNTVLVASETKEKRGQYEDQVVRSFQLNTILAKEMADMLRGMLTIKKIVVNEQLNTVMIRDTEDVLRLAERLIQANDKKPAEIIFDVEILEVSRSKAEKLGLDFGNYQITAAIPPYPLNGSFATARNAGTLTLPSATLRFFKQDVDGKTLANPKIRVESGKSAKIHIGDRVPLRATTIQDATGQVRTTFDYKEIGIRLLVEPTVHLDNSSTVKLSLEVSSLGDNVGTVSEPAFRIGTRNAETWMLLRDGETAILGGLIQGDERKGRVRVAGLGDIPILGTLFTSFDDSTGRSDVLLTITPRVVRGWDLPSKAAREFYSGTENTYIDKPLFAALSNLAVAEGGTPVAPKIDISGAPLVAVVNEPAPIATGAPAASATPVDSSPARAAPPIIAFSEPVYEATAGEEVEIKITGQNLAGVTSLPINVLFNGQLLNVVRVLPGEPAPQSFNAAVDEAKGGLALTLTYAPDAAPKDNATLARVIVRGAKPGVSYLIHQAPAIGGPNGETINAQLRPSRVVVK